MRAIRTTVAAGFLAAPLLLGAAACATAPTTDAVGLGDSYAAGPLITPQDPASPGCLRSLVNYPHRVALQENYKLTDVSCSGATTADMTHSQTGYDGKAVPPQLNALSAGTDVVTLTIGGNDIGFTGIIQKCVAFTPTGPTASGSPTCKAYYTAGGTDQLAARIADTKPKVVAVLQAIQQRSPSAHTYVAGYPAILPEAVPTPNTCYPQMPLTPTDIGYLRGVEKQLNQMLKDASAANGATYVDTYSPTIGHDACKPPLVRWVEPVAQAAPDAAPVHPNRYGEAAMAKAVEASTP